MVIKFPVVGAVDGGSVTVLEVDPQPVNTPASSATPIIFTNLLWGIRLKSLLQFSSGNVTWQRLAGNPGDAEVSISTDPRLFLR
jgi:hypothetical protein